MLCCRRLLFLAWGVDGRGEQSEAGQDIGELRADGLIALTGGLIGSPGSIDSRHESYTGTELEGMLAFSGSRDPDPHVPWSLVEAPASLLRAREVDVTAKRYPGRPHTVTPEELDHARALIRRALV